MCDKVKIRMLALQANNVWHGDLLRHFSGICFRSMMICHFAISNVLFDNMTLMIVTF
jgi:hypothetical protein